MDRTRIDWYLREMAKRPQITAEDFRREVEQKIRDAFDCARDGRRMKEGGIKDAVEWLTARYEHAVATAYRAGLEAAAVRAALADDVKVLEYIVEADKTRYDYDPGKRKSEIAKKPDGSLPPVGQCWLTPKEKALARLKEIRALPLDGAGKCGTGDKT